MMKGTIVGIANTNETILRVLPMDSLDMFVQGTTISDLIVGDFNLEISVGGWKRLRLEFDWGIEEGVVWRQSYSVNVT